MDRGGPIWGFEIEGFCTIYNKDDGKGLSGTPVVQYLHG